MTGTQTKRKKTDDLFEKSSMTFGEHLEELRRALAKSMAWLVVGMAISLTFANSIVQYIETPLKSALKKYYDDKADQEWKKNHGQAMPVDLRAWMKAQGFTPEIVYVFDESHLEEASGSDLPPPVPLHLPKVDEGTTASPPTDDASQEENGNAATKLEANQLPGDSDDLTEGKAKGILWVPSERTTERLLPKWLFRKTATNTDALSVTEPFMVYLKAGLVAGFVLASPGIFWHLWGFVSAGLYPHERRYVYFFLPASVGLFVGGAALAFFGVFQIVLKFLLSFNDSLGIDAAPRLNDYMSFALLLPLGFGVAFQLPLVMFVLERIGLCSINMYLSQWRWAMLIIAFLSMVLTPGDITPMIAMMIPLIGLYFLGIALCKYVPRGTAMGTGGYDAE